MLKWNDFEVIVAIKETRTLSAAARRLELNQSTVSRILQRIEMELEEPLFSNVSGHYQVTPEGESYFRVGKEIEKAVSDLGRLKSDSKIRGTVRLTTTEALVGYLVSRIERFNEDFPCISVELNGSNNKANLSRREFNGALRLSREENSKFLLIKKVGELGISGYRKHSSASREWIGYESSLATVPEEKWLRSQTKIRKQRLGVSSYLTMEKAIEHGLGAGLLPCFMGDHNLALQRITGERSVLIRPIWFITHPESRQNPAMRCFSTWLFKQFGDDKSFLLGASAKVIR